jgi:chemotaxis protein MotB
MSKRRKKKNEDEHISESWLIPYADILTLLLALFIVLFAMSDVDAKKFKSMAQSFNEVFSSGTGIFEYPSPMPDEEAQGLDPQDKDTREKETGEKGQDEDEQSELERQAQQADKEELKYIQGKVNSFIDDKSLKNRLSTSLTDEGLLVSIRDNVLFESGSADVRPADLKVAKEISELLVLDPPRTIVISGHTDNVPIKNAQYESNWELSVMRAVNFMKIVLENDKLDPQWFSAKGYGEYQPVASNSTSEGRAKNRRVEILILPRSSD